MDQRGNRPPAIRSRSTFITCVAVLLSTMVASGGGESCFAQPCAHANTCCNIINGYTCGTDLSTCGYGCASGDCSECGGYQQGAVCPFGHCCSASGFCGTTAAHCGTGCQSGTCYECGMYVDGALCANNTCCGPNHTCGTSIDHCGVGCQSGNCLQCGAVIGNTTCPDGSCCSASGFCGNSTAHCGTGCQGGPCLECGAHTDLSCPDGQCCNALGMCGTNYTFCGPGCQGGACYECGTQLSQQEFNPAVCRRATDCCSPDGFCGTSLYHCGLGCQTGNCLECGINAGNATCEPEKGLARCCGVDGYCGKSGKYCGYGCQNGPCWECGPFVNDTACPNNLCCGASGFCNSPLDNCGDGCQLGCGAGCQGGPCLECGPFLGNAGCPKTGQCCNNEGMCGDDYSDCVRSCHSGCTLAPRRVTLLPALLLGRWVGRRQIRGVAQIAIFNYTATVTSRLYAPVLGNFSLRGFSSDDRPTGVLLYELRYGGIAGPLAFNFSSEVHFNQSGGNSSINSNIKYVGVVDHVYTPKYSGTLFRIARTPTNYLLQITSAKYPRGAAKGRLG